MNNTVFTVTSCTVDGVLFRTKPIQDCKKNKTDNSCIVGALNLSDVSGQNGEHKCYGIIKKLYVHFMYPPSCSTYKFNIKKLATIGTPWILCALCDWYEPIGETPTSGLVRIRRNTHWQGCPIHNMANVFPRNVVFWPECPFNPDHFNDDGDCIDKSKLKGGQYDFSGSGVLNVINL